MENIYKLLKTLEETDKVLMDVLNQVDKVDDNVKNILNKWLKVRTSVYSKLNSELETIEKKPILNDNFGEKLEKYFNSSTFEMPEYNDNILPTIETGFPTLPTIDNIKPGEMIVPTLDSEQPIITFENSLELEEEPDMTPAKIIGDSKLTTSDVITKAVEAINKLQHSLLEVEEPKIARAA